MINKSYESVYKNDYLLQSLCIDCTIFQISKVNLASKLSPRDVRLFKFVRSSRVHRALTVDSNLVLILHRALTVSAHCVFTCAIRSAQFVPTVHKSLTVHSLCVHCAFILRSAFVQLLFFVQSVFIYIHLELQSKKNRCLRVTAKWEKNAWVKVEWNLHINNIILIKI